MKKILSTIVILLQFGMLSAQDAHFSMFNDIPLIINPAYTGDQPGDLRVGLNYRNQWGSINTPYKTYAASIDGSFQKYKKRKNNFTLGLLFLNDVAGQAKMGTTNVGLSGAYIHSLTPKHRFGIGTQLAYAQKSIDFSQLTWDNQYDGAMFNSSLPSRERFTNQNTNYIDVSAGISWIYYANDNFQSRLGIAMYHLNVPGLTWYDNSSAKVPVRLTAHYSCEISQNNNRVSYVPSVLYQQQGKQSELIGGIVMKYLLSEGSKITGWIKETSVDFGAFYRTNDAVILTGAFYISNYAIGFSYDITTGELAAPTASLGGPEIFLKYSTPFMSRFYKKAPSSF